MKGFTGATLLALVTGFIGLAQAAKAAADVAHNADMAGMVQAIHLTEKSPHGWKAARNHWGWGPRHHWKESGSSGKCPRGTTKCGKYCFDLQTDSDHCLTCDGEVSFRWSPAVNLLSLLTKHAIGKCPQWAECFGTGQGCDCPPTLQDICYGECVDMDTDANNCG